MGLDMIDRVERFLVDDRKGACRQDANEQGTAQSGPISDGYSIDVIPGAMRIVQCLPHDTIDCLYMATCGNLWDDTTVLRLESSVCPSSTIAAAVSSQLDSIPSTFICSSITE